MPNPVILEVFNVERSTANDLDAGAYGQTTRMGKMLEDLAGELGGSVARWEPIRDGGIWHLRCHVKYP